MHNKNFILTACDEGYYASFQNFLYSYERAGEYNNSEVIFYDLGLTEEQVDHFNEVLLDEYPNLEYRKFDFSKYPEFVKPQHRTFSWKPIIINEVLFEKEGNVFWMDSANLILKNLKPIWKIIEKTGSWIPVSGSGTLEEWTMQETLDYMEVPEMHYSARNRAGNTCAFSYKNEVIRKLVFKWKKLALIKECIRPEGATRENHRDDQSVLTILLLDKLDKKKIKLTSDEVDISSSKPTPYISVRNKLDGTLLPGPGELAYRYFSVMRGLDIFANKIKGN